MYYMHKETGTIDTREGWIESYDADELEERGLTAEQAFFEDEGATLIQITPEYCTQTDDGNCQTCPLAHDKLDCHDKPINPAFTTSTTRG